MSFILMLLYVAFAYVFPGELFPALAPYKIVLTICILGLFLSVVRLFISGEYAVGRPQLYLLAGLTAAIMMSVLWADRWWGGALDALQGFGDSITMFLLIIWNVNSFRKLKAVVFLMIALSVFLSVQGIAAFHYGYRTDELIMADTTEDDYAPEDIDATPVLRIRGFGVMQDPNDLALGLLCSLPLLTSLWGKQKRLRTLVLLVLTAALSYAIFLTHSRGAVLGVLGMMLVGFMPRLGRIRSVAVTVLFACALMAINVSGGRAMTSEDDSAAGRVDSWSEGLQMLKEQPVLGVGYKNYTDHNRLTAHNSFVLCFAELGFVGYFFWIALLTTTFLQLSAIRRMHDISAQAARHWATILRLSLVGFLFGAFFLSRTYIPLLYLLLGLSIALVAIVKKQGRSVPLPPTGKLAGIVAGWTVGSVIFMYVFVRINMILVK